MWETVCVQRLCVYTKDNTKWSRYVVRRRRDEETENERAAHLQNHKKRYWVKRPEKMVIQLENIWWTLITESVLQYNNTHIQQQDLNRERMKQMHNLHNIIFLLILVPWPKSVLTVLCSHSTEKPPIYVVGWETSG